MPRGVDPDFYDTDFLVVNQVHEGSFEIKTPGEGKAKKAQPLVTPHQKKEEN